MSDTQAPIVDATVTEQQPVQVQLQLADVLGAAQLIQLASTRGAFRAEEFSQIGGVYDRIVTFLKDSGAIAPADTAQAGDTETPAN